MKHDLDDEGRNVHVDVDPQIPTGICAICTDSNYSEENDQKVTVDTTSQWAFLAD